MSSNKEEINEDTNEQSTESNILERTSNVQQSNLRQQIAKELDNLERKSMMQESVSQFNNEESTTNIQSSDDTKQTETGQEDVVYDKNHNKPIHKSTNRQSNNKPGPRNTKNVRYKFSYSQYYIDKLGDIHDPKWKLQMAHTLSNCSYKRRINGNYDQTGMNNFKIYYCKYIILF